MNRCWIAVCILVLSATSGQAQNNYYNSQQRQNAEYKNLSNATQRAYTVPDRPATAPANKSTSSPSTTTSGSSSTISGNSGSGTRQGTFVSKDERAAQEAAARRNALGELERRRAAEAENAKQAAALEIDNRNKINYTKSDRDQFFQEKMKLFNGSVLSVVDIREMLFDEYWLKTSQVGPVDYLPAARAYMAFVKDSATASYDTLMALAIRCRPLPYSTGRILLQLRKKYPEHMEAIEQSELMAKAYYFGANRPNIYMGSNYSISYPLSRVEDGALENDLRANMIERFVALAKKYPEKGLIAAGFCRPHTSPFLLYSKWCKDDDCLADMYTRIVYTRITRRGRDYEGYAAGDNSPYDQDKLLERQLGVAAPWLVAHRSEMLENLSVEEWLKIADAQDLDIRRIAYAFRDPAKPDDYKKHYRNLQKAIKRATR